MPLFDHESIALLGANNDANILKQLRLDQVIVKMISLPWMHIFLFVTEK